MARNLPILKAASHPFPWSVVERECVSELRGKKNANYIYADIVDSFGFYVAEWLNVEQAKEVCAILNAAKAKD